VIKAAQDCGVSTHMIESAQKSPVYKWVKEWNLALPLHAEYRTVPMLFYVPPLLPVMGNISHNLYDNNGDQFFTSIDDCRLPIKYLASLFSCGDESLVRDVLKKLMAVRVHRREVTTGDISRSQADDALSQAGITAEEAEAIYKLSSLCTFDQRFVIPASHREEAIEMTKMVLEHKGEVGFGFKEDPERI